MVRLRVLGGLALEGESGSAITPLPKRRAEAVLAVLAVCADLGCTRERLFALLWPESDDAHSRHGLRDALHCIRSVLGPGVVTGGRLLRLDATVVDSDVRAFRQATGDGRLEDAVRVYTGPLLDGFHVDGAPEFEQWLDGERARLAREYAEALKRLAQHAAAQGAWTDAAGWWARAVEHDPLNSHLVLQQAESLAAMGDRANAIKVAEAHVRRLREELELEPDQEFLARIEALRIGRAGAPGMSVHTPASNAEAPHSAAVIPSEERPAASVEHTAATRVSSPVVAKTRVRALTWTLGIVAIVVVGGAIGYWLLPKATPETPHHPRTAIAVLPFKTVKADSSSTYIAAGLRDELLTQLTRIPSLTVIGRMSVGGYQETSKPLRLIGDELGVGSIVEASVQVDGRRLRVIVRLVDPETQVTLWTERYQRTIDDVFAVQSDIVQRIVAGVGVALSGAEAASIAAAPTQNAQAYQFYLLALQYERRPGLWHQNLASAQQLYERALSLDSTFAEAHARLAIVHYLMWDLRYDRTDARLTQARREAATANRLAPQLPQAHLALGLAEYRSRGADREDLKELHIALRYAPNDAELWGWIARVHKDLENWDSVFVAYDRARRLDPRDENVLMNLANTLHYLRRYSEAIGVYRQALVLGPEVIQTRLSMAWSYVLWKGELDTLRAVLRDLPTEADPGVGGGTVSSNRLALLFMERQPDSVLALLRVLNQGPSVDPRSNAGYSARAHLLRGDSVAAHAAFDSAATYFDSLSRASPNEVALHAALGEALAGLGKRQRALREARWLEQHTRMAELPRALILARCGDVDGALAVIEPLLAGPSTTSVNYLRLDPHWEVIVKNPRGAALLAKYAETGI